MHCLGRRLMVAFRFSFVRSFVLFFVSVKNVWAILNELIYLPRYQQYVFLISTGFENIIYPDDLKKKFENNKHS